MRPGRLTALLVLGLPGLACYRPPPLNGPDLAVAAFRTRTQSSSRQWTPGSVRALTADEASALALVVSISLREQEARVAAAQAAAEEAGVLPNPEARVSDERFPTPRDGQLRQDLALRIKLPRPGEIGAKVARANHQAEAQQAGLAAAERALAARVRDLHWRVRFYDAEIVAAQAHLDVARKLEALVQTQLDKGLATRTDAALSRSEVASAEHDFAALRAERGEAYGSLLALLDAPTGAQVALVGPPVEALPPPLPGTEEELVETAMRRRPEVRAAAAAMGAAGAEVYLEWSEAWPWFSFLQVGWEREYPEDERSWRFGGGIEIPLFSLNSGGIRRAEAEQVARRLELHAAAQAIAAEVRGQLAQVRGAADLVGTAARVEETASLAVEEARLALAAGQIETTALLRLELRSTAARHEKLDSLRAYQKALAALQEAVGSEKEERRQPAAALMP